MKETIVPIKSALGLFGDFTQVTNKRGGRVYRLDFLPNRPSVPSVTSVVDNSLRNHGLEHWRNNWILEGLRQNRNQTVTNELIEDVMSASTLEADRSKNLGVAAHKLIEKVLREEDINEELMDDRMDGVLRSFLRWRKEFGDWSVVDTEVGVWEYDVETGRGYAGQVDAIFQKGNTLMIVDWKTSSGIYESAAIQLAAYTEALRTMIEVDDHSKVMSAASNQNGHRPPVDSVVACCVRLVSDYPRDQHNKKMRHLPKVMNGNVEYSWITEEWFDVFTAAFILSENPLALDKKMLGEE